MGSGPECITKLVRIEKVFAAWSLKKWEEKEKKKALLNQNAVIATRH